MQAFRTRIQLSEFPFRINHQHKLLAIGSCFAEHMGNSLERFKFPILNNPLGILFNPISLQKVLKNCLEADTVDWASGLLEHQGRFFHYDYHSDYWAEDPSLLIDRLRQDSLRVKEYLKHTDLLLLTWGTARVYHRLDQGSLVASCHKQAAALFEKRMLQVEEILKNFMDFWHLLKTFNPGLKVLMTLSPVRHTRDTLIINQVSKSTLRLAQHELCEMLEDCFYFPSYEIMLDDLRDYRFYEKDLIHPNELAQDYIWQHFQQSLMDQNTRELNKKWLKLLVALEHRPNYPGSPSHVGFLRKTLARLEDFEDQLSLQPEIQSIREQLKQFDPSL